MDIELKPCPFCKGEARQSSKWNNWTNSDAVICTECGAVVTSLKDGDEVERWNRRTGNGTCHRVPHPKRQFGPQFTCSECGYGISDMRWEYCPKCGCKVVDE